jgi:hypothetical protein
MGAVRVDLTAARAAVEVAASQAADLVRSLPDPSSRVPGLDWTVGQTAAHLVAAARFYPRYATGQATQRQPSTLPRATSTGSPKWATTDWRSWPTC